MSNAPGSEKVETPTAGNSQADRETLQFNPTEKVILIWFKKNGDLDQTKFELPKIMSKLKQLDPNIIVINFRKEPSLDIYSLQVETSLPSSHLIHTVESVESVKNAQEEFHYTIQQ